MAATNFCVTLSLATPLHLKEPLTLDGLLSAALFNATGLPDDALVSMIPLEQQDGIFKGSALFCASRRYRHTPVSRIMALNTPRDLATDKFHPKGKRYTYIDRARGPYKSNLSTYPGIEAKEVCFWGVGDAERVGYLLKNFVLGLGKRATGGAGEIIAVDVTEIEEDRSWVTASGQPARPLPVALWDKLGGSAAPTKRMAVRFPYWKAEKVDAVFPGSLIA